MKPFFLFIVLLLSPVVYSMMAEQKREAGQYFSEYQHLNRQADYHGAREKLNVAIALVPKNYDYFKVKPKNNFYNNFINIFFF